MARRTRRRPEVLVRSNFFFDYKILGRHEEDPIPLWQIQEFVFKKMHGAISRHWHGRVALGFPDYSPASVGETFRFFAQEAGALDALALEFFRDSRLRSCGHLGSVQVVGDVSSWVAFKRIRPFDKQSFSKIGVFPEVNERLMARIQNCPTIKITSSSTGNPLIITVYKETLREIGLVGVPDGYGLSRRSQVVPVPVC